MTGAAAPAGGAWPDPRTDAGLRPHAPAEYRAFRKKLSSAGRLACAGDARFIRDHPSTEDVEAVRAVCAACPLFEACAAYARAERPTAGFWAGVLWRDRSPVDGAAATARPQRAPTGRYRAAVVYDGPPLYRPGCQRAS